QGGGKNDLYRKTPVVPAGGKERTYLGTTRVITGRREKMISIENPPLSPGGSPALRMSRGARGKSCQSEERIILG
ncbi:hypothetical protein, partial [Methylobacterium nigriterrae]|uniref:hypothetical protein n=1 Tax=Methylobacterium nigriterrae TaxID=3127512 RepID=UPI003013312A